MNIKGIFHGKSGSIITCVLEIVVGVLLLINPVGFTSGIIIGAGVLLITGGLVSILRYFVGKPEILNFWASWCPPCKAEMPDFEKAYKKHGKDIHFLMVNITYGSGETVEKASSFIESKGYTFPVFYDTAYSASSTYGAYSLPTTYFIDADGNIVNAVIYFPNFKSSF